MSNVNTKNNVRTIAVTGMLSAVAVVLMYLEIPIPIMPGFIKFDFSDLPALLGAYALGPVAGIIICLIKNVVHLAASQSMLVGELSNFILGSVFVFTAGIVYKKITLYSVPYSCLQQELFIRRKSLRQEHCLAVYAVPWQWGYSVCSRII